MAKKNAVKKGKKQEIQEPENMLPQNILAVGEKVEENKNIYISQPAYRTIHKFTKGKTKNESGGVLVGDVIEEFGKANIVIRGFVEAKYCEATPTTLKFTHETWDYLHGEIDKKFKGMKIVGWIHTHPNFGIFLSEYDTFIQENFFKEPYQVAYVIDPVQNEEGFYFWIGEELTRCKGFYLFDKNGVKITEIEKQEELEEEEPVGGIWRVLTIPNILITALLACVVILFFSNLQLQKRIAEVEKRCAIIENTLQQHDIPLVPPGYVLVPSGGEGATDPTTLPDTTDPSATGADNGGSENNG